MSTVVAAETRIDHVRVTRSEIIAHLADGRAISVPLAWSWRLSDATPAQRSNFRLIGEGHGIHWPDVRRCSFWRAGLKKLFRSPSSGHGRTHASYSPHGPTTRLNPMIRFW